MRSAWMDCKVKLLIKIRRPVVNAEFGFQPADHVASRFAANRDWERLP